MIIAFPVNENKGLESPVFEHFGMAKEFLIVDTSSNSFNSIINPKQADKSFSCKTNRFTEDYKVNTVITLCIGSGSLRNLTKDQIQIFKAEPGTVQANLDLLKNGTLKPFHMLDICRKEKNKKQGGSCGHHH